ncbi:uncharacterized protein LOC110608737 isoform X2 [Manihot esculenta]|uniref:uncharacterized protein LOC110608737 isoform X2 n=1 Tax=Manihot esculenta TaxID=3983 RepID=UPI000B5D09AB|nr:uncharacterized protein LOC110608737 isoform X2 [Manihot esculenta]
MTSSGTTAVIEPNAPESNSDPLEDASSPFFLYHSLVLIIPELILDNFPFWRRWFMLAISIRNKQGFLDGSIPKPSPENPLYLPWIRCNNLIVVWLLRSISSSIASTVFYLEDAIQIWDKLHQRFSQPDDYRICHLQHLLCNTTQDQD